MIKVFSDSLVFTSFVYFASIAVLKGLKVHNFNFHHLEVTLRCFI